jgi:Short C-terminal domain
VNTWFWTEGHVGLLKTGLKAAVAVKTADVIHERVLARQQQHAAAHGHPGPVAAVAQPVPAAPPAPAAPPPPAPAAPPPPAPASPDMADRLEQLKQLGELRAAGVLTDGEFEVQKARILS